MRRKNNLQSRNSPRSKDTASRILHKIRRIRKRIPNGSANSRSQDKLLGQESSAEVEDHVYPLSDVLGHKLPEAADLQILLQTYFIKVHWDLMVVYEPKFRREYESVKSGKCPTLRRDFVFLLATMAGVATSHQQRLDADHFQGQPYMTEDLLNHVELYLEELLEQPSLASLQVCTLFAYHLNTNSRSRESFALFSTVLNKARTLGLHHDWIGDFDTREERKRVWWTIYAWDRHNFITSGCQLSISEAEHDVDVLSDLPESCSFVQTLNVTSRDMIVYSAYHRELSRLYRMAACAMEAILLLRARSSRVDIRRYDRIVSRFHLGRLSWQQKLPANLRIDMNTDAHFAASDPRQIYLRQALMLQQVADLLVIITHQPFLSVDDSRATTNGSPTKTSERYPNDAREEGERLQYFVKVPASAISYSEEMWNAAVRIFQYARWARSYFLISAGQLEARIAAHLYNAAIALGILCIPIPLSLQAQEGKLHIAGICRLAGNLGRQSIGICYGKVILTRITCTLLEREKVLMLAQSS